LAASEYEKKLKKQEAELREIREKSNAQDYRYDGQDVCVTQKEQMYTYKRIKSKKKVLDSYKMSYY